jgi:hypothetical protein
MEREHTENGEDALRKEGRNVARKGRKAKGGLYANINRRKRLGISRSKKNSSISSKAYSFMKAGFKKKRKKRGKKKKTKKR